MHSSARTRPSDFKKDIPSREDVLTRAGDLSSRTKDGSATLEEVTKTLTLARTYFERIPKIEDQKALCYDLNLGGRSLLWLWTHATLSEGKDDQATRELLRPLCWFLIAEGQKDYLRDWIHISCRKCVELRDQVRNRKRFLDSYHHVGRLAGYFLTALVLWAPKNNANDSIKQFLGLHALIKSKGPYYEGLSLLPSAVAISRHTRDSKSAPCDAGLFEMFITATTLIWGPRAAEEQARAQLFHPSSPSAHDFLTLVEGEHDRLREATFDHLRFDSKRRLAIDFLRAAYILRLQGYEDKAVKLEEIVQRTDRFAWDRREPLRETTFEKDVRLHKLRAEHRKKPASE